ncbi:pyruvate kinase [Trichlorobacter ammonificans]|uniref:Pyruvate kinase n=1 Tax=Trichlorobacter ammonificans TaxID=2916410 RepID=A0ABN8HH33_9BACT|nr:pyruvate kinase [Trichlorobacter ammonificans]CAH2030424.1 Pyruvate kinase [Trichlorobacter ammonificans]
MHRDKRKTKIVATLGPSSSTPEMLERLITAGVDLFRLNFSHGTQEDKQRLISTIREASAKLGKQVGILADLQGPKIRTGKMAGEGMLLEKGKEVAITTDAVEGKDGIIPTIYTELPRDVVPGAQILLDDGLLELKVLAIEGERIRCLVVNGGLLKNNKGINLPGVRVSAPSLTEKDLADLDFCLTAVVDYIAMSFVRTHEDVEQIKRIIYAAGKDIPVVAKIEKPEALRNFNKILKVTDAVMVARGDLGVEMKAEKVPLIQKKIIKACNEAGKPVITATQMLESMITNPRPTRAETSDVANAIIDGTDAVMLSGETASGRFPVEAVETMVHIARDVETAGFGCRSDTPVSATPSIAQAVGEAACRAAISLKAKAIAVFTQSGSTAALISRFRPPIPIVAFTSSDRIQRKLALYWGVRARSIQSLENMDQQIHVAEQALLASGLKKGDIVVIIMGTPVEARGSTNLMKIHKLGAGRFFEIF